MPHLKERPPLGRALGSIGAVLALVVLITASTALAADTVPPVSVATLTPAPDGNANWRRVPATLNLFATDDVGVEKFQYSLDAGLTYIDVPATAGPAGYTGSVSITQQGNTTLRYRAVDTSGNLSTGTAGATTLNAAAAAGATAVRLTNTAGRTAGDLLVIDTNAGHRQNGPLVSEPERATIASLVEPAPAAPAPNVLLTAPLARAHPAGAAVSPEGTIAVLIDSLAPVATWPQVVDGKILQSQILTPTRTDPRRRDATDTANGSGATAIRRMEVDGKHVIPFPLVLNRLTVGEHTQAVALQDAAGNALKHKLTFVVTTSFDDLDAVLVQYANNALSSTLSGATAAGATGIRLATVYGFRAGQTLVIDTGANQETVTVASAPSPPPAAPAAQLVLSTPLTLAHASGVVVSNPRPLISAATAATLRALVTQAKDAAALGNSRDAIKALKQFKATVKDEVKGQGDGRAEKKAGKAQRAALTSAADALIDQVKGDSVDTSGAGITTSPWTPITRLFPYATPFAAVPGATYKVLVNGQTRGFRHEHIPQTEWMVQQLGRRNGFDVEIWDPNLAQGPGLQIPAGISLTSNPLLDLNKLMEYKTLVFASTVGRGAQGLNATELANLQAYIRAGGGFVAVHGATDSMQDVPWYMDLVGAGFTNHGGNAGGIMPDCGSCGEVELINVDPAHTTTKHLPDRFIIHDELYNTNRNPVELGIVHPLILENEASLVGQLNYSTGTLMNSDKHGMVWCRNFEGGRSFTTVIGHSWALTFDSWYRQMLLKAIQTTSGVAYGNCVTFSEVSNLLAAYVAAGSISSGDNVTLSGRLAAAKTAFDLGSYKTSIRELDAFVKRARQLDNEELTFKGKELIDWAKGLNDEDDDEDDD